MADNARGIHVSPGVYSKEIDMNYAVKSLGITTLGLVGETQRGPAFQPMSIENWREFQDTFGGTSTEKFVGSQYPKYELPYIAKSYLTESNQLKVCRVLGLSGYNAGPAWMLTAPINGENMVVAVLRSRGDYKKYTSYSISSEGTCSCSTNEYDKLTYDVGTINYSTNDSSDYCAYPRHTWGDALQITKYTPFDSTNTCAKLTISGGNASDFNVTSSNYGHFKLVGIVGEVYYNDITEGKGSDLAKKIGSGSTNGIISGENHTYSYFEYPVSLNPSDKDYILKVLGTNQQDGTAPIYVESLYDVAYQERVDNAQITMLSSGLTFYDNYTIKDFCQLKPVNDILTKQEKELTRKDVGKRFLCEYSGFTCHDYNYSAKTFISTNGIAQSAFAQIGKIYTVKQYTDSANTRHYYYANISASTVPGENSTIKSEKQAYYINCDILKKVNDIDKADEDKVAHAVKNLNDGFYYILDSTSAVTKVTCDLNNYKSEYRFASTPWIVSNIKGDYKSAELNKLFRFHTISDGNNANNEIKISIANIRPDEGTFDVIIRDINDTDANQVKLESYSRCNLIPGSSRYIGYLIGTYNGDYEPKSKYITVEVNENITAQYSTPSGFIGYPMPRYDGNQIVEPSSILTKNNIPCSSATFPRISYNCVYDEDIKHRRQYFGLSDITGVDIDLFTFKGNSAYQTGEDEPYFVTPGFHLDSRLGEVDNVTVEGIRGYEFDTVSTNSATELYDGIPLVGTEAEMAGSIFEYVDLRKFTVYFYGGFDGWDDYRDGRSNTDDFKMSKYKGVYSKTSGEGYAFSKLRNLDLYKINDSDAITSDYYAYLSAIRQFSNPEEVDINVFATPGVDIVNNTLLTEEIIDMIEEERADSIYVATMPDKPYGANDYVDEMYSPDDTVSNLEGTNIDSNYTCTYYPWIKYYDEDNYQYINLPVTKDVVRNMALTDNTTYPWFAPAGISRGNVSCEHAHYTTTLSDEDTLYEGRINPVKTFATDGVKLWGQKNLQVTESQLNRIAVRRLLLRMRKLVAIACRNLIFEPNDNTTKASFISTVTPIMDNIKSNRGISDYKIEVNDSVESRERRELPASIYFKPINALEYITLNFVVTPEGVSFDNI